MHYVKSVRIRSYSGPHFPVFGLNTDRSGVSLRIQSKWGKIRTRVTPNTDTFYAVMTWLRNPYSKWAFSGLHTDGGQKGPLPKTCHTYPAMMKLGTAIPYLNKIQKIFKSRYTLLELYWHQRFFTGNQLILGYQEIQI